MKTAKDLELSLLLKEKQIQDLKLEKVKIIENGLILRKRIDEAIEFLNNECLYDEDFGFCDDLWCGQVQELVDILKGVDKEWKK